MRLIALTILLSLLYSSSKAQIELDVDGINTDFYDVERKNKTTLTVRRCLFETGKENGFVLKAGDDSYVSQNANNLDEARILGNKFVWTGYSNYPSSILHGAMLGYNINYTVKHNYNDGIPYAFIYKGGNDKRMEWTSGAHAYNIHKNVKIGVNVKGMSGVKILNNTFYNTRYSNWHHIGVLENNGSDQTPPYAPSNNTIIQNNIFYQKDNNPTIKLFNGSQNGLVIDYNIYWCEDCDDNTPEFEVEGRRVTWDEWQDLGYDLNSRILNPNFIDEENFVPTERLDNGTSLGEEFEYGLSTNAQWTIGTYPDTTKQNGDWQIGAVIHSGPNGIFNSHTKEKLNLYPNPNNGIFWVEFKQSEPIEVIISNIGGQVISKHIIHPTGGIKKFDMSSLTPGFYIFYIEGHNYYAKFLKQ